MNKQELYTKLASIVKNPESSDAQISLAKSLTTKILRNQISLDEATNRLQDILKLSTHPMLETIKGKPVYKNLVKYYSGDLSDTDTLKMISSLITHSIIESSINENYKLVDASPLSSLLSDIISGCDISKGDIDKVLESVGLGKEVI